MFRKNDRRATIDPPNGLREFYETLPFVSTSFP